VYVVNRSRSQELETQIQLTNGEFNGRASAYTVNGKNIKSENTFKTPDAVTTKKSYFKVAGCTVTYTFAPHSVTALVYKIT